MADSVLETSISQILNIPQLALESRPSGFDIIGIRMGDDLRRILGRTSR
jgi:hypothetical protein